MKALPRYEDGMSLNRSHISAAALAILLLLPPTASAGKDGFVLADIEQDEAREAVKRGVIRPLEDVLAEFRQTVTGDIVEIELDEDDGRYVYEIEYVAPDGHLMEIKIDAKTLAVVSHEEDDED